MALQNPSIFSLDFLTRMAHEHLLSPEQRVVFILRLGSGKEYDEIAEHLKISKDACVKRMSEVYRKFKIEGDKRGKEEDLRALLLDKFQHLEAIDPSISEPRLVDKILAELDELKRQIDYLSACQLGDSTVQLHESPADWASQLDEQLCRSGKESVKRVLYNFATSLPKAIERAAATSRCTELDVTHAILSKAVTVFQTLDDTETFRTEDDL